MQTIRVADFEVRWVGDRGPAVVLFHGFGAPGTDLVPLAGALKNERQYVFPAAPIRLPPAYGDGRAWWSLDMAALQQAMMTGIPRDLSGEHPETLPDLRGQVHSLIHAVGERAGVSGVHLGGFSQGAMLATDYALHHRVRSLTILSGTYLAKDWWKPRLAELADVPVFQSHGRQDAVLSIQGADALRDALEEAKVQVAWHPFEGGHGIPPTVLQELDRFLDDAG
ncbi:MAG: hypothetical protein AAF938_00015 [Myxococcota bacterium]